MDTLIGKVSKSTPTEYHRIGESRPVKLIESARWNELQELNRNNDRTLTTIASLRFIVGQANSPGFALVGGMQITTCTTINVIFQGLKWIP